MQILLGEQPDGLSEQEMKNIFLRMMPTHWRHHFRLSGQRITNEALTFADLVGYMTTAHALEPNTPSFHGARGRAGGRGQLHGSRGSGRHADRRQGPYRRPHTSFHHPYARQRSRAAPHDPCPEHPHGSHTWGDCSRNPNSRNFRGGSRYGRGSGRGNGQGRGHSSHRFPYRLSYSNPHLQNITFAEFGTSLKCDGISAYVFDAPNIPYDVIVGRDWMLTNKFDIVFSEWQMEWFGQHVPLKPKDEVFCLAQQQLLPSDEMHIYAADLLLDTYATNLLLANTMVPP